MIKRPIVPKTEGRAQLKQKRCKQCGEKFTPRKPLQRVCGWFCGLAWAKVLRDKNEAKKAKEDRKSHREAILKSKPSSYYRQKAQTAFNAYIRARDGKVCISCGTTKPDIQYCAGHYRTRGAAKHLSFNEDNVHSQCNKNCNLKLSGNILNYRPRLIAKIGLARVEALENDNSTVRFTIEDLKEITKVYKAKLKGLK